MRRIVIIDAEQSVTDPLTYLLQQSGFQVQVLSSGSAALAETDGGALDMVLLDLELPDADMSGLDVCRELRARSAVPIIVVTASDDEADKIAAFAVGADDYVAKPFSGRELTARIHAVLRRYEGQDQTPAGAPEGAVLTAGPLRIDVDRHRVSLGGVELVLRLKEFTVLELLVRRRGHVVTRGQLIERIWGDHFDGDPKRADAIINRLRGKLEVDPTDPHHLLTVRGLGYGSSRDPPDGYRWGRPRPIGIGRGGSKPRLVEWAGP